MKKITVILMCMLLGFLFVGCTAANLDQSFSGRKAWQLVDGVKSHREQITFEATSHRYNGGQATLIASGDLTFNLKETSVDSTTTLTTALNLLHNEESVYTGEDSVESTVVFNYSSLLPVSSTKTLTRATVTSSRGYTAETDYSAKKTTITPVNGTEKSYNLKNGEYFDNEQLYHLVRCIPNLKTGASYSFNLFTPYDSYANNEFFTHKISVRVSSTLVQERVPKEIYDMAIPRSAEGDTGKLHDSDVYYIDCMYVTISLNAEKSGPDIYMYISDLNFLDMEILKDIPSAYTSNIPVRIVTGEVDDITGIKTYQNEYKISGYSTTAVI